MNKYMKSAYTEALMAFEENEVPVGAVIVLNNKVIAKGHNSKIRDLEITAHAEINVLKIASKKLGRVNLHDCDIYITLEPCSMCLSAILQSNIKNIYFGANDPTMGAIESKMKIAEFPLGNSAVTIGGIMELECSKLLSSFFKKIRK
jgi:tRNA(adenine34) deaminase